MSFFSDLIKYCVDFTGQESKEEGASKTKCYELTKTAIPHYPALCRRGMRVGSEVKPGKKKVVGGRRFLDLFLLLIILLCVTGKKLN